MSVGKTPALSTTDRSQYAKYVNQVREALASQKDAQVKKAVGALSTHLNKLESQGKDVSKLLAKKDADVIETVRGRGFKGLPDSFTASLARFAKSGKQKDKLNDGTDHSADIKKQVDAKMPPKSKADQAFEALQNSPELTEFYTALASTAGPGLAQGLEPFVALQQKINPKAAADFEKLVASQKSVEDKVAGFRNNPVTRDATAILLGQYAAMSKPTRDAIRAEAKKSGHKFSDVCDGLRNEMIMTLHNAQAGISAQAQKAFTIDENSDAFQALSPKQQKQLRAHNKQVQAIMQKMATDPSSLTADDQKVLDMTPDEVWAAADGTAAGATAAGAAGAAAAGAAASAAAPGAATGIDQRLAELKKSDPNLYRTVMDMRDERERFNNMADRNLSDVMNLIHSGLPIEVIVMLVMVKLTEKHERKLQLKLKEAAAVEAFEKHNANAEKIAEKTGTKPKTIDANDYGVPAQSTTMFMQGLQVAQQQYMQIMNALSAIIRQIQDMINTVIRNIHS